MMITPFQILMKFKQLVKTGFRLPTTGIYDMYRFIAQENIRNGTDDFYVAQHRRLVRSTRRLNAKYILNVAQSIPSRTTSQMEEEELVHKVPMEIQYLVISFSDSSTDLKTQRLVSRDWDREILRHTPLFSSLLFNHSSSKYPLECVLDERFVSTFISWRGLESTVTSITLFNWHLDHRCWFLHLLKAVKFVRIIKCKPWKWLYCLPLSVTHLVIKDTQIHVTPDLHRLVDNNSQLISLSLDNADFQNLVDLYYDYPTGHNNNDINYLWKLEHGINGNNMQFDPRKPIILEELSLYETGLETLDVYDILYLLAGDANMYLASYHASGGIDRVINHRITGEFVTRL
ncbi:uncharacterized protein ARMOST_04518 [Armillaria ostoyae]|uniref:F-box domain-containing protein n=1 Tax=Armillaria ostoyae TaxID=47428 RepID=A0A284QXK9_ARMOS|nr:uncharacterized protein ARMOST_04518 [Armillaria ostoyae]